MPFAWPTLQDVFYRLVRLRRLVAVTVLLPLSLFVLLGAFGASEVGGSLNGLILLTLLFTGVLGSHAVVFPNAYQETLILSVIATCFAVFAAYFSGSFAAWFIFSAVSFWLFFAGQGKLGAFQLASRVHKPTFKSKLLVRAKLHDARDWFPLNPDMERGNFKCGALGEDGSFPVWFDPKSLDVFEGLIDPEALADVEAQDPPEMPASFWARVDINEPDYQRTLIGRSGADGWTTDAVVEHRFRSTKTGNCVVTEFDMPVSYPVGQSVTLWLTDYQSDGLVFLADLLEQKPTLALRVAHRWSLLTLLGRWFAKRQMQHFSEA